MSSCPEKYVEEKPVNVEKEEVKISETVVDSGSNEN